MSLTFWFGHSIPEKVLGSIWKSLNIGVYNQRNDETRLTNDIIRTNMLLAGRNQPPPSKRNSPIQLNQLDK